MDVKRCDRCETVYSKEDENENRRDYSCELYQYSKLKDLCPECKKKLELWFFKSGPYTEINVKDIIGD